MTSAEAKAILRSILKHHPFFRYAGYQPWGWDFRTFALLYPYGAMIYRKAWKAYH